jgi:hypothetical protein
LQGDAFNTEELAKSCRFDSSGLNLAFEGLLLGVSLRTLVEGTCSEPRQLGSRIPNILDYAREMLVVFCKKPKVSEVPMQRQRRIDGTEACVTERAEARVQKWGANHQSEVPRAAQHVEALHWPAKGGALM